MPEDLPGLLPGPLPAPPDVLLGATPATLRKWFDDAMTGALPECDGTLDSVRAIAEKAALPGKAENTPRASRQVRLWRAHPGRSAQHPSAKIGFEMISFASRSGPDASPRMG